MKSRTIFFTITAATVCLLLLGILLPSGQVAAQSKELNIWTWGVYGPDFATKSFEQKYGIKVNCTFYHGNEELWSKMQAGHQGVDIIQPSNHLIQRFARAGLLAPIDVSKMPNYAGLMESFKNATYNVVDGKLYSVPYTFGIMGVGYRSDLVKETPNSWGVLWDKKYEKKLAFSRNPIDACFAVGKYLGMDISKLDEDTDAKLALIKEKMREQNPLLLKRVESLQEMRNLLAAGDICPPRTMAHHKMMLQDQPMKFFVPGRRCVRIDQFKCLRWTHEAAYRWIDHMLSPEIASQMIQKMGYMVVNAKVVSALPPEMAKLMTYTDEETKRLVPYPTLKSETQEKMTKAYHDVRGQ
jgi:spermidine/putrescine-binding protein